MDELENKIVQLVNEDELGKDYNAFPKTITSAVIDIESGKYINELIPTKLPNPHPITINGTVYDGSAEVELDITGGETIEQEQVDWNETDVSDVKFIKNKPTIPSIEGLATVEQLSDYNTITEADDKYVSKVSGKQLSTEDFTTLMKDKLLSQATGLDTSWKQGVEDKDVELTTSLTKKQDKLTAGENIIISPVGDDLIISSDSRKVKVIKFSDTTEFIAVKGLPSEQGWEESKTGSAIITNVSIDNKLMTEITDSTDNGKADIIKHITNDKFKQLLRYGGKVYGISKLDPNHGNEGFWVGAQWSETYRFGVWFRNEGGYLQVKGIGGEQVVNPITTFDGTEGKQRIWFSDIFTWEIRIPSNDDPEINYLQINSGELIINNKETGILIDYVAGANIDPTGIYLSSMSTGGDEHVSYHQKFGFEINFLDLTITQDIISGVDDLIIITPDGEVNLSVTFDNISGRELGSTFKIISNNINGVINLIGGDTFTFNGWEDKEISVLESTSVFGINSLEGGNEYSLVVGNISEQVNGLKGNVSEEFNTLEKIEGKIMENGFPSIQKMDVEMTDKVFIKGEGEDEAKYFTMEQIKGSLNEEVLVTLASNQAGDNGLIGATVNMSYAPDHSENKTWNGEELSFEIPMNNVYTITASKAGYLPIPTATHKARAGFVRQVGMEAEKIITSYITIDDSINDPNSKVGGDIGKNGTPGNNAISWIRANSHRVLAKKTDKGKVTYCRLKDTDGTKYYDGTDAPLTTNGIDVMMKLPRFFYKWSQVGDVHTIGFANDKMDTTWKEWDGQDLIGAYEVVKVSNKCYSRSGVTSTGAVLQTNLKSYARARGDGYTLVKWKHHCIMAVLYYAMYGNTNCQASIGSGTGSDNKPTGVTDALGMTDTVAGGNGDSNSINYWGLENWWGNKYEFVDNVIFHNGWKITEDDNSVRTVPNVEGANFPNKLRLGEHLDMVPTAYTGTATTGYCDYVWAGDSGANNRVARRSYGNSFAYGGVADMNVYHTTSITDASVGSRLAFRGELTEAENVAEFTALPIL